MPLEDKESGCIAAVPRNAIEKLTRTTPWKYLGCTYFLCSQNIRSAIVCLPRDSKETVKVSSVSQSRNELVQENAGVKSLNKLKVQLVFSKQSFQLFATKY